MPILCQICRYCGKNPRCWCFGPDKLPIHTVRQCKRYQGKHCPCQWSSHAVTTRVAATCLQDGVKCQHGPNECKLNRLVSCAIHLNPDQNVWFPFVKCLESQVLSKVHPLEPAEQCAADAGINFTAVQECASGMQLGCHRFADTVLCQSLSRPTCVRHSFQQTLYSALV